MRDGESRRSTVYQMSTPIDKALGEGNCGSGDRPWGGSLRMRRQADHHVFRRRPHSHQTCEATDRNVIQGRFGQASGPSITKPFPVDRPGKWRACAGKVHVLIRGELESGSGSRLYAESRSRVGKPARRFQQSAEAIVGTPLWCSEGPNRGEQGGATSELGSRILLRPELTDPARVDQPALSLSLKGDSGAELAPLRGTA